MIPKLDPEFQFAGFTFPKWEWNLHRGPWRKRLERRRSSCTGWGNYTATRPLEGRDLSRFFYLDSDGMPNLRWKWCDEVKGAWKPHTGWYCDDYQNQTIRGLVMRLANKRGFLAGWSMGESMASAVDYYVFDTEVDAAQCADSMAENAAKREREYEWSQMELENADDEDVQTSPCYQALA